MTSPATATVTTGGTVVLDGAAGTEISFTKPSTVVAGDLILATVTTDGSATLTPTAGWTQTITPLAISTGAKLHVFHRIAAGSTPGFYVVGTPTGKWGGVLTTYHDVDTTTPFDVAFKTAVNVTYTASSLTIPGVTTVTPGAMVVAGIGADKADALFGQPSGSTTLGEAHAGQGTQVDVSSWPAPGSTGNVVYTFAANTAVAGFVGAIRPKTLAAATPTTAALTLTPGAGTITADWTLSVGSDGGNGAIVSRDGTDTTGAGPWTAPNALGTSGTRTFDKLVNGSTYSIKVQPTKDGAAVGTATTKSAVPTSGTTTPPAPVASFTSSTLSGTAPLAVSFTDTSTNTPTSWSWTFGDGSSSTTQNPSKTYATAGTYVVTLTAANAGGTSASVSKSISVSAAPTGPSVTLVSPTSGQTLSGSVTFNATSPDAASIAYYVDGIKVAEDLTTPDFDEAVDTTTLSNGSHVVKAVATNANGSTTTPEVTVTVSNGTTTPPSGGTAPVGVPGSWTLTFADEFTGTALDTTKWAPNWYAEGGEMNNVGTYARNVSVANGELRLQLESTTAGALIHTDISGGYRFPVGSYVEARIYFPGPSSTSLSNWAAWWASSTASDGWPSSGEHDIAEILSGQLTVNYHSPSGSHNQGAVSGFTPGNSWHTYGVHRKAGSADVYWDGVKVKSYATDDNGRPEILILNVGNGSNDAFGAAGAMRVDYVRAWSPQA